MRRSALFSVVVILGLLPPPSVSQQAGVTREGNRFVRDFHGNAPGRLILTIYLIRFARSCVICPASVHGGGWPVGIETGSERGSRLSACSK